MSIEQNILNNREKILELAEKHGAYNVRMMKSSTGAGSRAGIDIDFLIKTGKNTTPWFPGGLVTALEDLLGYQVGILMEEGLHPNIRDIMLNNAVPV
ncbi:DNA polymerase subunit beta [Candidatus Magnetomoraceae bacterium gMMP-15]